VEKDGNGVPADDEFAAEDFVVELNSTFGVF